MEYELRLTTFQLDSLEKILLDCIKHDCQQIIQMVVADDYSIYDIEHHGATCSNIARLLEEIKESRESGKNDT